MTILFTHTTRSTPNHPLRANASGVHPHSVRLALLVGLRLQVDSLQIIGRRSNPNECHITPSGQYDIHLTANHLGRVLNRFDLYL